MKARSFRALSVVFVLILSSGNMASAESYDVTAGMNPSRQRIVDLARQGDIAVRDRSQASLKPYNEALELARSQNDHLAAAALLNVIGGLYEGGSDYQSALGYYEGGLRAIENISIPSAESFARDALNRVRGHEKGYNEPILRTPTVTDLYRGEITDFKDFLERGDTEARQELEMMLMINAGNMYANQRQFETAETYYKSALAAARAYHSSRREQDSIANLAWSAIKKGDFVEADTLLNTLLAVVPSSGVPVELRQSFLAVGVSLREQKRYTEAQSKLEQALLLYERSGDQRGRAICLLHLAQVFLESGNITDAKEKYLEALQINTAQPSPDRETTGSLFEGLARMYEQMGEPWQALAYYERYAETLEAIGDSWRTDQGQVSFRESHEKTLSDYIRLVTTVAAPTGRYDSVRRAIEQIRSRSLRSLLEGTTACRPKRVAGDLNAAELWPDMRKRPVERNIFVQENVAVTVPRALDCQPEGQPPAAAQDQPVTFLEYYVLPQQTVILVKSPGGAVAGAIAPIGEGEIGTLVSQYLEDLEKTSSPDKSSRQLYQKLIAPVETFLPDDFRQPVVIVPHRSLWRLPFASLRAHHDNYFGDQHVLTYAASEKIFQLTGGRQRTTDHRNIRGWIIANPAMPASVDVCGRRQGLDPLAGAQTEGEEIQRILGLDRAHLFVGSQADRLRLEAWHPDFTILHFATHGFACPDNPLSSTLVLSNLKGDELKIDHDTGRLFWPSEERRQPNARFSVLLKDLDKNKVDPLKNFSYTGLLTARTIISDFNLQADLVVLSACQTALGKLMGDGMIGFARAFMASGARSVLVSLWRVDDWATEALMVAFYKEYVRHGNKGLALQAAMQTVRDRYPHPKNWAAFSLFGPAE